MSEPLNPSVPWSFGGCLQYLEMPDNSGVLVAAALYQAAFFAQPSAYRLELVTYSSMISKQRLLDSLHVTCG